MNRWLLLVLLVAFFVRVYRLDTLTLFGDEIDVGNQAYSLLTTAKDYRGNLLPSYLQSFTESRAPLLIYLTVPSVAIFGRNEYGVRLPAVVFGLASILGFYLLSYRLTKSNKISLLASLLLSVTPWHFHYSRAAFEVTLLLSLLIFATWFYLQSKPITSLVLFALSFYTYNTANVFTPLLLLFLCLTHHLPFKKVFPGLILSLIVVLPLLFQIILGQAGNRFSLISVFNSSQIINQIVDQRISVSSGPPSFFERIFHNKLIAYPVTITTNYLTSFSPQFIFFNGDPNPRHQVPNFGPLLLIFAPLLIIGLLKYHQKYPLFLFWLLISPIASSLTVDGGQHATRLFTMLPPLIFFTTIGLQSLNFKTLALLTPLIFMNFTLYLHQYFVHLPKINFSSWNYGQKYLYSTPIPPSSPVYVSNTNFDSLNSYIFYQHQNSQLTQDPSFSDVEQANVIDNLPGFKLNPNTYFINNWQTPDTLNLIQQTAKKGNIYFLLQLKDIPGDWDLTKSPLPGFVTLNTVYLPNHQIYGQVIQKL